jgi:serine/threonine protein kinase
MAPEHVAGGAIGPAADVWSLGVVLYECVAGTGPFPALDRAALAANVLLGRVRPLLSVRPELDTSFAAAVDRALKRDLGLRYRDMREMAQHLVAAAEHSGLSLDSSLARGGTARFDPASLAPLAVLDSARAAPTEPCAVPEPTGHEQAASTGAQRSRQGRAGARPSMLRSRAEDPRASTLRSRAEDPRASTRAGPRASKLWRLAGVLLICVFPPAQLHEASGVSARAAAPSRPRVSLPAPSAEAAVEPEPSIAAAPATVSNPRSAPPEERAQGPDSPPGVLVPAARKSKRTKPSAPVEADPRAAAAAPAGTRSGVALEWK